MTTLRIARRRQYVTLDSRAVNDRRMSFRARGILAWLLEKPDGWTVNATAISNAGKEGRDAVRAALDELEGGGYLVRSKYRDAGGVWRTEAVIYEHPDCSQPVDNAGDNRGDQDGKPVLVNRHGKPGAVVTTTSETSLADGPPLTPRGGDAPPAKASIAAARARVRRKVA